MGLQNDFPLSRTFFFFYQLRDFMCYHGPLVLLLTPQQDFAPVLAVVALPPALKKWERQHRAAKSNAQLVPVTSIHASRGQILHALLISTSSTCGFNTACGKNSDMCLLKKWINRLIKRCISSAIFISSIPLPELKYPSRSFKKQS